jgi:hypothetical protein
VGLANGDCSEGGKQWVSVSPRDIFLVLWERVPLVVSSLCFELPSARANTLKTQTLAGHWWLMPVILAMQEAEISQPRQIVRETLSRKKKKS